MRTLVVFSIVIAALGVCDAHAQPAQKSAAPAGTTLRYFRMNDMLGETGSDAILIETRRGATVTSAVLDLCYSTSFNSSRKDRFVVTLSAEGNKLVGAGQTQEEKLPVRVQLTRTADGTDFDFEGTIVRGTVTTAVSSTGNSDQSEADFNTGQVTGDPSIVVAPSDFSEVTPGYVSVRIRREALGDLLKALRAENVKLALDSLVAGCDELRAGEQTVRMEVDPENASALIGKLKTLKGVTAAGWNAGAYNIAYAVRLAAPEWRPGGALDRNKLSAAITAAMAKALAATPLSTQWDASTGVLTLKFKRPNQSIPGLSLTDTIAATFLAGPERPAFSEALVVWIGAMTFTTTDEGPEPRLSFARPAESEGDVQPEGVDLDAVVTALAQDLRGKRWDSDRSTWQP